MNPLIQTRLPFANGNSVFQIVRRFARAQLQVGMLRRRNGVRISNQIDSVHIENLESRRLLAGVTLITHGYEASYGEPQWLDSMANAIAARAGSGTSIYDLTIGENSSGDAQETSFDLVSGPGFSYSANADAVVILNWVDVSGIVPGVTYFTTSSIAQLVAPYLKQSFPNIGINTPLADVPIHLIGHSRGGSLVSALAWDLGQSGIWVDQLTTLDPVPVLSDAAVNAYSNVTFADNYYETDSLTPGEVISGANNVNLSGLFPTALPDTAPHEDVHSYYYGTIDTTATTDGAGTAINPSWYSYSNTGPQDEIGFDYSLIADGSRPSDGLATAFGGSASRVSITGATGTQWPNIGALTLTDSGSQFEIGTALHAQFSFEDDNTTSPTVSLFLDNDESPYDSGSSSYPVAGPTSYSQGSAGVYHPTNPVTLATTNVPAGQYYLYAEIADGTNTRYAYDETPIILTTPPPPTISGVVYNDMSGNGSSNSGTTVGGVTINLYGEDDATLLTHTTSSTTDGSFSFGNLAPGTTYYWRQALPTGWIQTSPSNGTGWNATNVASGQTYTGSFDDFQEISISGVVKQDATGDGVGNGDTPLGGVTVDLYQNGGTTSILNMISGADGSYSFNNLGPGTYTVQEIPPAGWTQTGGNSGYTVTAQSGQNVNGDNFDNFDPLPSTPANLVATVASDSEIDLAWTDSANNAAGFYIDRYEGSSWVQIGSTSSTTYSDTGLAPSSTYDYSIAAYNSAGESEFTTLVSATTQVVPLVTNLNLSWITVPTALSTRGKKNKVQFEIHNTGNVRVKGSVHINLYASTVQSFDSSDPYLTTFNANVNLRSGTLKFFTFKFGPPYSVAGQYYLIAVESNYGNNSAISTLLTTIP